jgi:hypothetical protein
MHQLIFLVQTEARDATLFGVKDPRICRSVPLWLEIMKKCQREPVAIITIRHPLAVARSLAKRDGMPIDKALLLWLRHLLDAERDTRCIPRVFVNYHHLIENWRLVADRIASALGIQWPESSELAGETIDQFLKPGLRHWTAEDSELEEVAGAPWFKDAWRAFCSSATDQFRRDDVFDRIGNDADAGMRPFQNYFGLIETSLELAQHQAIQSATALDKAKWLLGSSVMENSQPIKPWAESIESLEERLENLERRIEQLKSGSNEHF